LKKREGGGEEEIRPRLYQFITYLLISLQAALAKKKRNKKEKTAARASDSEHNNGPTPSRIGSALAFLRGKGKKKKSEGERRYLPFSPLLFFVLGRFFFRKGGKGKGERKGGGVGLSRKADWPSMMAAGIGAPGGEREKEEGEGRARGRLDMISKRAQAPAAELLFPI